MPDLTSADIDRLLEPIVITGGEVLDDGRLYASFVWPARLGELFVPNDEFSLVKRSTLAERVRELEAEIARLAKELGRAYRALHGHANAAAAGRVPDDTMRAYHSLTVAAAARFVRESSLEGGDYFVGKGLDELRAALAQKEGRS